MAQPEFFSDPSAPPGDLSRTMLPKNMVAVVIGLAFLPIILNGLGISFSAVPVPAAVQEDDRDFARAVYRAAGSAAQARSSTSYWNGRPS